MKEEDNQNELEQIKSSPKKFEKVKMNREIAIVTYIFIGLFVILIGNLAFFLASDNSKIMNNPYNKRQDLLAAKVVRGNILGSKGEVLAETIVTKSGEEVRSYPYDRIFCHVVGRLSKGKSGVESSQNVNLLSSSINPITTIMNEVQGVKNPGDSIVTTLDVKLQATAYQALGSRKGAIVVMDPTNGKILAMVSKPDYDPNKIDEEWEVLLEDEGEDSSLMNRVTQGLYPPGSTFKIVTALEYMRENIDYKDFEFHCKGKATFDGATVNCYANTKHGIEDINTAFAKSCNSAFSSIGIGLNLNEYLKLCKKLLFNEKLPVDFEYKKSSFVLNAEAETAEVMQTAIGQGKTMISPLHNALIVSAIANGGKMMRPYLVNHIENQSKYVVKEFESEEAGTLMSEEKAKILTELMRGVVTGGTAKALNKKNYTAVGKTGSAEYNDEKESHAWFVGFAYKGEKKLVVSIIVEGAGTGGEYAVPIAGKIFDTYWKK